MAAPPPVPTAPHTSPGFTRMTRHPLLNDLAIRTSHILDVFGKLPAEIQMDGLDMLQNVVNSVMQKITAGRVTAVKFVPVEGLAVTGDSSLSLAAHIKEEPLWLETTDELGSGVITTGSDLANSQSKKTQGQHKTIKTTKKTKANNNQQSKKTPHKSSQAPNTAKKTSSIQNEAEPVVPKKRKKKEQAPKEGSENSNTEEKTQFNNKAKCKEKKPAGKGKVVLKNNVNVGAKTKKAVALKNVKQNTHAKKADVGNKDVTDESHRNEDLKDSSDIKSEDDDNYDLPDMDDMDSSDDKVNSTPVDTVTNSVVNGNVGLLTPPKTPCKPEVIALLKPVMRMQPPGQRGKRKQRDTPGRFQCDHCEYSSDKKFHFNAHLITHTGEKKFFCEKCNKVFTVFSSLKRHLMAHEGLKPHQCPICGRTFLDLSALRIHSVVHTDEQVYECPVCFKEFVDLNDLYEHEIQHEGERLYKCDKCDKMYTNSANLSRHRRVHTGEMPYSCKVEGCGIRFRDLSSLKLHNLKHTGEKPYTCEFCGMKFKTSSDYLRHRRRHTNERNYECQLCHKKFIQGWHLKQHERMHADHRPWVCELCDKKFRSKASLNHHTKWHRGIKEYKCDICNKMFSTKKYLASHQVIHTNDKPFECKTCGSHFNQISNLKRHERIHSDVKQYKCNFCPKAFKYINSWRYHEGTHKGSMYTCEKCGMSFKSPQGHKAHKCTTDRKEFAENKIGTDFESFIQESSHDTDLEDLDEEERNEIVDEKENSTEQSLEPESNTDKCPAKAFMKAKERPNRKLTKPLKIKLKSAGLQNAAKKKKPVGAKKGTNAPGSIKSPKSKKAKGVPKVGDKIDIINSKNKQNQVEEELDLLSEGVVESQSAAEGSSNILVLNNDTNESIIVLKTELPDDNDYEIHGNNTEEILQNNYEQLTAEINDVIDHGRQNCVDSQVVGNVNSIEENSIPNGDIPDDVSLILTDQKSPDVTESLTDSVSNKNSDHSMILQDKLVRSKLSDGGKNPMEDSNDSGDDVAIMKDAYIEGQSNLHVTNIFGVVAGH